MIGSLFPYLKTLLLDPFNYVGHMETRTALWNKFSFDHVGPWVKTQDVVFLIKHLYLQGLLAILFIFFFLLNLFSRQRRQISLGKRVSIFQLDALVEEAKHILPSMSRKVTFKFKLVSQYKLNIFHCVPFLEMR